MARKGITFEQVATVSDYLLSKKINPTIDKVRQALGNTGSNTKISNCLARWRAERLAKSDLGYESTEDDVSGKTILEELRRAQIQAFEKMKSGLEAELAEVKERQAQCKEDLDQALKLVSQLSMDNDSLKAKLAEERTTIEQAREGRLRAEGELRGCQDALKQQEKSSDELRQAYENALAEIKACHQSELHNLKEGLRIAKDSMEDYRTRYMVDVDNLKIKNEQLQSKVFELVMKRKDAEALNQRLKLELGQSKRELNLLNQDLILKRNMKDTVFSPD